MKTFLLVLLLLFPTGSFADIFENTGSDGVVHFTDDASKVPKAKKRNVMEGAAAPFTKDAESKIRHEFMCK